MTVETDKLIIRPYSSTDKWYIVKTWLTYFKDHSSFAKRIRKTHFMKHHEKVIEKVLARASCLAYILCPKEDEEIILGFLVCEKRAPHIIHFIFIKQELRSMGLGKKLFYHANLNENELHISHLTDAAEVVMEKYKGIDYVPYLMF